jgi:hypothetical protein
MTIRRQAPFISGAEVVVRLVVQRRAVKGGSMRFLFAGVLGLAAAVSSGCASAPMPAPRTLGADHLLVRVVPMEGGAADAPVRRIEVELVSGTGWVDFDGTTVHVGARDPLSGPRFADRVALGSGLTALAMPTLVAAGPASLDVEGLQRAEGANVGAGRPDVSAHVEIRSAESGAVHLMVRLQRSDAPQASRAGEPPDVESRQVNFRVPDGKTAFVSAAFSPR